MVRQGLIVCLVWGDDVHVVWVCGRRDPVVAALSGCENAACLLLLALKHAVLSKPYRRGAKGSGVVLGAVWSARRGAGRNSWA